MNMFCYQCQETLKNEGCTKKGVCGKEQQVANLQDLLIYNLKGMAHLMQEDKKRCLSEQEQTVQSFITESLFATVTNVNFDQNYFLKKNREAFALKQKLLDILTNAGKIKNPQKEFHPSATLNSTNEQEYAALGKKNGVLQTENEDKRSLQELLIYGLKGIAAYKHHAEIFNYHDREIDNFIIEALTAVLDQPDTERLLELVTRCGQTGVKVMALLDKAHTETYGHPEPTKVELGTGNNPGILISGHDLKDMAELLAQTEGKGVDVYTHGEMLPAHYYPAFKKYNHFKGNYGGSWWKQGKEFTSFNGPILMTTNCITPPKTAYTDRLFTTGVAGYAGLPHIPDRKPGQSKDFSPLIKMAQEAKPPEQLEEGTLTGGFAHAYVTSVADKIIEGIKNGAIRKFVVMAGCDGRQKGRDYYREFAEKMPHDTIILTAGCAKYRYNKLQLGEINSIPRILDAGQCNDSYSLAVIALKLAEATGLKINELPLVYNIAWYEQKAVIVLLALLSLGVKNIKLGPSLPAFLSPGVARIITKKFGINGISEPDQDLKELIS
ncbi:MAG TPA: hydroxylamine reductase [Spirochaetota bacterium]|nr:hydroxylamine reductase [Spirochaetota bacterium]